MRELIIQEEQRHVDHTIQEIEEVIEQLANRKRKPMDLGQEYVESRNKGRISEYKDALSEPYIGKLELIEGEQVSTYRIGKIPVAKDEVTDIVYDWRTPYGNAYYGFSGGEGNITIATPGGKEELTVNRKRSVHIRNQQVIDVRDTLSNQYRKPALQPGETVDEIAPDLTDDRLAQIWFEKNTDHQIKEIIATIQKEQNEIIRMGIARPVLVQGVAGSGKTSIALHRISYLLYAYGKQLSADKIMVLAPNQMFLSYMKQVVKDLDIAGIQQSTVIDFARSLLKFAKEVKTPQQWLTEFIDNPGRMEEMAPILAEKTSLAFKERVESYLATREEEFLPADVPQLVYIVPPETETAEKWKEIYEGYQHLPLNKRRTETIKSIRNWAEMELKKQEKHLENRYLATVKEWTSGLPEELVERKEWEGKLREVAGLRLRLMKENWQQGLTAYFDSWKPLNTLECYIDVCREQGWHSDDLNQKKIGYEDLGALLHMERKIEGTDVLLDYLVIDEMQDLNPFLTDSLKPLAKSLTMLGDISQCIYPWTGFRDWSDLGSIFGDELQYMETFVSYRSTFEIMELANHILQASASSLPVIQPINRHGDHPQLIEVSDGADLVQKLCHSIQLMVKKGHPKIAVICKEGALSRALYHKILELGVESIQLVEDSQAQLRERVVFIPVSLVKGLEFDAVIIPNANNRSFVDELDSRLLFVSVTRAQQEVHLLYFGTPSPFLSEYPFQPEQVLRTV
ncbi:UvrD-helicase domain-containing protein [Brevibacillus centrosporus]|uniref:HelD family protein n=1 Tax=Brevibacillus centrosporus TaxID=54910 RepID=UPI003D198871